jgi:hypothetical protein
MFIMIKLLIKIGVLNVQRCNITIAFPFFNIIGDEIKQL